MAPWWDDPRLVDTLPISPEAYLHLLARLAALDAPARGSPPAHLHSHPLPARVLLRFADGTRAAYAAKVHYLGAAGLAFLHGFRIDPGTSCEVALRKMDQHVVVPSGQVARCRDLGEKIYEIGIDLSLPLDPGEFRPARSAAEWVRLAVHRPSR